MDLSRHYLNFDTFLRKSKKDFDLVLSEDITVSGSLEEYDVRKLLGTGSFGKVVLCTKRVPEGKDTQVYAMKIMEKANIIRTKQLAHTINEVRFLDAFHFPFIVHLVSFFKNNVYIFLVMPFVAGGELFYHLRKVKRFDEYSCKFYASQVVLAMEYMHAMGVVYRDLKPENILIDVDGYLKIADLGFCKKIDRSRTYTLCGTPEYLAPEVILSQGYSYSVDWWTLGVLIYEMSAGYPPFSARDHMKLYERIVAGKYAVPVSFSKPLKDITFNLLQNDRSRRYGILKNGVRDIKSHEWFKDINFDDILNKKMKAPFQPRLDGKGDTQFFDVYDENVSLRHSKIDEFADEFKDFNII